jgi:hypothetical protein
MLGTIAEEGRRAAILGKLDRHITFGGEVFLVENAEGSEFEAIRGRTNDQRTKKYNDWVEAQGFRVLVNLDAHFRFESHQAAGHIIGAIWGAEAAARVADATIGHKITIYRKALGR